MDTSMMKNVGVGATTINTKGDIPISEKKQRDAGHIFPHRQKTGLRKTSQTRLNAGGPSRT